MKMRSAQSVAVLAAVAAVGASVLPAAAQSSEQRILRRHFDRQLDRIVTEARESLPGLLRYPEELRNAVLELTRHPGLVVQLGAAADDPERFDAATAGFPEEVVEAALLLREHPEIIVILESNLVTTAILGRVYADDPAFIRRAVDKLAVDAEKEHKTSVDDWARGVRGDAAVADELQRAAEAYAEENGYEEPGESAGEAGETVEYVEPGYDSYDDDWWYHYYGYYLVPGGIVIGDLPCGDFIEWILDNCDRFPDLADKVVHHVRDRERGSAGVELRGEMETAFERWKSKHPETTMQGFLNDDGARRDRLRELGSASRELREAGGTGSVRQLAQRNPDRYPHLNRPAGPDRGARPSPGGSRGGGAARPAQPQPQPRNPTRQVQRVTPSQQQQLQRAITRHRTAWGGGRPTYRGPARGYGGRRGGIRRR